MAIYALNSQTRWTGNMPFESDCNIIDARFLSHAGTIEDLVIRMKEKVLEASREKFVMPDFSFMVEGIDVTRVESEHDQLLDDVGALLKQIPRIAQHAGYISRERPQPLCTHKERVELSEMHHLLKLLRRSVASMIVQASKRPGYEVDSVGELTELLAEAREHRLVKEFGHLELPEPYDFSEMNCDNYICAERGLEPFGPGAKFIAMSSYCQEVMPEKFTFDLTALDLSDEAITAIIDNLRNNDDIFVARDPRGLALYYAPVEHDDFSSPY